MNIITHPEYPSVWSAIRLGAGPDAPEGRGGNSQEAIQDLLDAEEEIAAAEDEMLAADLYDMEA